MDRYYSSNHADTSSGVKHQDSVDNISIWDDGASTARDPYDAMDSEDDEILANSLRQIGMNTQGKETKQQEDGAEAGQKSRQALLREREAAYALARTRRALTLVSQLVLKLEARAGLSTKEGIRLTLDATVADLDGPAAGGDDDGHHGAEIEELARLAEAAAQRMFVVDRSWRQVSRQQRREFEREQQERPSEKDPAAPPPLPGQLPDNGERPIALHGETSARSWLRAQARVAALEGEATCYYTAADRNGGRSVLEWITYLGKTCGPFELKTPRGQTKLCELAWRFLDRALRGPYPPNPTTLTGFARDLEERWRAQAALDDRDDRGGRGRRVGMTAKGKQVEEDERAWAALRKCWSSRSVM
ncbi:hypothetical protein GGR56DRAFT_390141 [Xylariaceae sp. FL0804]|nr:hypothetical protein GGR56DRAFT_390141 [Xylariaceae sp. FL0804]